MAKDKPNGMDESKPDVQSLIKADREARIRAFEADFQALKKKHRCDLRTFRVETNGIFGPMQYEIIATE